VGQGPPILPHTDRLTPACSPCALSKGMPLIGGAVDWMIDAFPGVIMVGAGKGERVDAEKLCREACRNPQLRAAMVAFYIARLHWEHISLIYLKYMSKSLIWPYQALIRLIF
jgi:hypothetical protein